MSNSTASSVTIESLKAALEKLENCYSPPVMFVSQDEYDLLVKEIPLMRDPSDQGNPCLVFPHPFGVAGWEVRVYPTKAEAVAAALAYRERTKRQFGLLNV